MYTDVIFHTMSHYFVMQFSVPLFFLPFFIHCFFCLCFHNHSWLKNVLRIQTSLYSFQRKLLYRCWPKVFFGSFVSMTARCTILFSCRRNILNLIEPNLVDLWQVLRCIFFSWLILMVTHVVFHWSHCLKNFILISHTF